MAVIQVYQYFVCNIEGRPPIQGGSLSEARSVTLGDDEVFDQTFNVGTETAVKVYDKTENESLGGFDFGWLEADFDVLVQYTTDAGGDDEYFVTEIKGSGTAGQMGPARVLNSDLAHQFDGTIDAFDGTEDTIDEIWVYNADDTDTAHVRVVLAT